MRIITTKLLLAVVACANAFTVPMMLGPIAPMLTSQSSQSSRRSMSFSSHNQRIRKVRRTLTTSRFSSSSSSSSSSASAASTSGESSSSPTPKTFREGEVLGLRLMQDGRHEEALKAFKVAMTLPGSRTDILRTANVSGPSPVGGSKGGTEGRSVQTLDEFEYQAGHYNMACAHATLGNVNESITNLRTAFEYGFDSYVAVRSDPDLVDIRDTSEFGALMDEYDPRNKGFNPFGVFGKR